jgi:hypothetical protein
MSAQAGIKLIVGSPPLSLLGGIGQIWIILNGDP